MLNVKSLSLLIPEITDKYINKDLVTLIINPKDTVDEAWEFVKKDTKFKFGNNTADFTIPLIFDIAVQHKGEWEIFRKGFMGFNLGASMIQHHDKAIKLTFDNIKAGFKKLVLIDLNAEDPDE
jgi:hypothetical protein